MTELGTSGHAVGSPHCASLAISKLLLTRLLNLYEFLLLLPKRLYIFCRNVHHYMLLAETSMDVFSGRKRILAENGSWPKCPKWVRALAWTGDRTVPAGFESNFGKLRFGTLAIPFTPLCQWITTKNLKTQKVKFVGKL